jgi:hypothetical protein
MLAETMCTGVSAPAVTRDSPDANHDDARNPVPMIRLRRTLLVLGVLVSLAGCSSDDDDGGNDSTSVPADPAGDRDFRAWYDDPETVAVQERVTRNKDAAELALQAQDLSALASATSAAADGYDELAEGGAPFSGEMATIAQGAWSACSSAYRSYSAEARRGDLQTMLELEPSLRTCNTELTHLVGALRVYDATHDDG